ncbi:MAG: bifunctional hydroxymethylpyrimidine kinase/phosphomethylpyrimidine kinase [Candidatus Omnitrophota bacterium]
MIPVALSIAGSDPSGGAGIQADLKTFHQHKVYGMAVITLLTAQNTRGVRAVYVMKPAQVIRQLEAVLEDIMPQAAKTGALGDDKLLRAVARAARQFKFPLVVDPVMISKHGAPLLKRNAVRVFIKELLPHAALVTPNLCEAEVLSGIKVRDPASMEKAARIIAGFGPQAVLVKGGHLEGEALDLFYQDGRVRFFRAPRIKTRHTHGTGCTYSAAITAELAKGNSLLAAVSSAKKFITRAIRTSPGLGQGMGPVNHFA